MNRLRDLPRRGPGRFMLIPLVDVIFLLIMFFMLTTSIAPYATIDLVTRTTGVSGTETPAAAPDAPVDLALVVSPGIVQVNGEPVPIAGFAARLEELRAAGAQTAVVLPRSSATVQDLVSVLEALKGSSLRSVTIRRRG